MSFPTGLENPIKAIKECRNNFTLMEQQLIFWRQPKVRGEKFTMKDHEMLSSEQLNNKHRAIKTYLFMKAFTCYS